MLIENAQIGKREQLADIIARADAKNTPVQATLPKKERITNMKMEWQLDTFEDAADIAVEDGVDVETFDNASPDRARVGVYAMKLRDSAMVSDLAENVSDVAGLSKGELAESIMKKLRKLARAREGFICGDQDTQNGGSGQAYKIRGLGSFINNSAQATEPIPTIFRTPAESIDTTAMASFAEATWQDVLTSIYEETGEVSDYILAVGPLLRRAISNTITKVNVTANAAAVQIRTYDTKFTGTIDSVVTQLNGDFGNLSVLPTLWNAHANFGGSEAANKRRGYVIRTDMASLHHARMPRVKQLEDRGGGPRFLCDEIIGFRVNSPLCFGAFKATT
jgi:hypothetical protein